MQVRKLAALYDEANLPGFKGGHSQSSPTMQPSPCAPTTGAQTEHQNQITFTDVFAGCILNFYYSKLINQAKWTFKYSKKVVGYILVLSRYNSFLPHLKKRKKKAH